MNTLAIVAIVGVVVGGGWAFAAWLNRRASARRLDDFMAEQRRQIREERARELEAEQFRSGNRFAGGRRGGKRDER